MKVKDLISELESYDPEDDVYFVCPSGDYWRTAIAMRPSWLTHEAVKHSSYHDQMVVVDAEEEWDEDCKEAVLIGG